MRLLPGQHERRAVAGFHIKGGLVGHVLADAMDRAVEADRVRSGDGPDGVALAPYPGHDLAVAEPEAKCRFHLDAAADTLDDAYHHGCRVIARRHEVDDANCAAHGVPGRLEDQRVALVLPADVTAPVHRPFADRWAYSPAAVVLVTQQGCEARVGVEPGQAQPVQCTIAADEGGGLHVTDQRVILDQARHRSLQFGASTPSSPSTSRYGDDGPVSQLSEERP